MTKTLAVVLMIGAVLIGCATLYTPSGVRAIGPNQYAISVDITEARGGEAGAREHALTAAKDHCTHLAEELTSSSYTEGKLGPATETGSSGTIELTFRCSGSGPGMSNPRDLPNGHY